MFLVQAAGNRQQQIGEIQSISRTTLDIHHLRSTKDRKKASEYPIVSKQGAMPTTGIPLAPELIRQIIRQADEDDLKNLRQVNKSWSIFATEEMFRQISLCPKKTSIKQWNAILKHKTLRQLPRRALIYSQDDWDDRENMVFHPGNKFDKFVDAVKSLSDLPNLDSLELSFSPNCVGARNADSWMIDETVEPTESRNELLKGILTAARRRHDDRRIRSLTINNLQNIPIAYITATPLFRSVMKGLDELHLQWTAEHSSSAPDHDYDVEELQTFPAHLSTEWLAPIANSLKALSLGTESDNWGPLPGYFAPVDLRFPNLKSLRLRYYTLAHDDQMDWVLAQKSLETLELQKCMIVSRLQPYDFEHWKIPTHDWQSVPRPDEEDEAWANFRYDGTWAVVFDKITESLPNLVNFTFDYNDDWAEKATPQRGSRVFPRRYVVFDQGILPTHWPEASDNGVLHEWNEPHPNLHEDHMEEDQQALDALLEACRKRAAGRSIVAS